MIGYLKGKVIDSYDNTLIIDVNCVGYEVEAAGVSALDGQDIELFIYTHVRENALKLFGFGTKDDLEIFKKLLGVNGVGPKSALTLIDSHGARSIVDAVLSENPKGVKVPGIGEKTAQKIILDMKSKVKNMNAAFMQKNTKVSTSVSGDDRISEAGDALLGLGYSPREIEGIISTLDIEDSDTSSTIVKKALGYLKK